MPQTPPAPTQEPQIPSLPNVPEPANMASAPPTIHPGLQPKNSLLSTVIVLLLLFLPPIAWVIMVVDKRYHSWFAKQMILFAVVYGIMSGIFAFIINPQLATLLKTEAKNQPNVMWLYGLMILCVVQIVFGYYLHTENKKAKTISYLQAGFSIAVLLVEFVGFSLMATTYLSFIYDVASGVN